MHKLVQSLLVMMKLLLVILILYWRWNMVCHHNLDEVWV
jgi:hypothetical protein